jgi:hypothetical protein
VTSVFFGRNVSVERNKSVVSEPIKLLSEDKAFVRDVVTMLRTKQTDRERSMYGDFFCLNGGGEQTFSPVSIICLAYRKHINPSAYFTFDETDRTTEFVADPLHVVGYVPCTDTAMLNAGKALDRWDSLVRVIANMPDFFDWSAQTLQAMYDDGMLLSEIAATLPINLKKLVQSVETAV